MATFGPHKGNVELKSKEMADGKVPARLRMEAGAAGLSALAAEAAGRSAARRVREAAAERRAAGRVPAGLAR